MQYISLKKADIKVSRFGMGCMRLPLAVLPDGSTKTECIDEEQAIAMIRYAIDNGVNYIDTAYPYHGGMSEVVVGRALLDGYRAKTFLASKSPIWQIQKYDDFEKILDEQLNRLQTDCIDFYLLHGLNQHQWPRLKALNVIQFLEEAAAKGKIKYPCFSFHGTLTCFKEIVNDYHGWVVGQIMLNYIDDGFQAGLEGMRLLEQKQINTVVMEPLKGGMLVNMLPNEILALFQQNQPDWDAVEWAMRWVYSFPEVKVVLSGVSSMEQLKGQLDILNGRTQVDLTSEQMQVMAEAKRIFMDKFAVPCSGCNYCRECPQGVSIADTFAIYNMLSFFNEKGAAKMRYSQLVDQKRCALQCVECGYCESRCPQDIPIIKKLKEAHQVLMQL